MVALLADTAEEQAYAGDQLYLDLDLSHANLPTGSQLAFGDARRRRSGHRGQRQAAQRLRQVRHPLRRRRGALREQRDGQGAAACVASTPGWSRPASSGPATSSASSVGVVWTTRQVPVPGAPSPSNVRGDTRHPPTGGHHASTPSHCCPAHHVRPLRGRRGRTRRREAGQRQRQRSPQAPLPRVPRERRGRRRRDGHHHRRHLPRQPGDRDHRRHASSRRPVGRGRRGAFTGTIVFTNDAGTLVAPVVGTLDTASGEFVSTSDSVTGTDGYADVTGRLTFAGVEDIGGLTFTETCTASSASRRRSSTAASRQPLGRNFADAQRALSLVTGHAPILDM